MREYRQWILSAILFTFLIVQSVTVAADEVKPAEPVADPPILSLKIDRADVAQLPRNFRMGKDDYKGVTKTGIIPSREGMATMNSSASSCFSEKELEAILKTVPVKPEQFYDIDLRGESHGYLDGTAISWFANHDWGNDGRPEEIILPLEQEQLASLRNEPEISIFRYDDSKNIILTPITLPYKQVRSEEEVVRAHGAKYFRLALMDHFRPDDPDVDRFVAFYKQLPKDAWLHYHCYAGMGRTTIFMVMHDILKNASKVSFNDIIQRQKLIGIVDLSDIPDKKKNYGRKAYIERYQFVRHFYDYVKENPNLDVPYSEWAKKNKVETWEPDYSGHIWRIDATAGDAKALPRNFRMADSAFKQMDDMKKVGVDPNYVPSRAGLNNLPISASAEFSVPSFHAMLPALRAKATGDIYIVDLRQESHGFMNDMAVSWYGDRNWGNLNKTQDEVIRDENARIRAAKGQSLILAELDKNKMPIDPKTVRIDRAMTERELVEGAGLRYVRFAVTDHTWAKPETIDAFIDFVKKAPSNSWMHFHCQAGKGRTTSFMVMYDMMKNPSVSLKDILQRQYLLGGSYIAYDPSMPYPTKNWKDDYYHVKARMVAKFYEYVQQNHANNYVTPWSVWLKNHK